MGFMEELMGGMVGDGKDLMIYDADRIREAMSRPKLEGLQPGDVLRQKKLGEIYRYKGADNPMVFVRYATESDGGQNQKGAPIDVSDIVIAVLDSRDGQLVRYAVESTHFEKI